MNYKTEFLFKDFNLLINNLEYFNDYTISLNDKKDVKILIKCTEIKYKLDSYYSDILRLREFFKDIPGTKEIFCSYKCFIDKYDDEVCRDYNALLITIPKNFIIM